MKSIAQPCAGVNAPNGVSIPHSTDPHPETTSAITADSMPSASSRLIAANKQLMARRAERTGCAAAAVEGQSDAPDVSCIAAVLNALPAHLGWGSGRSAAVLRAQGVAGNAKADAYAESDRSGGKYRFRIDINPDTTPSRPSTTVKAYPTMLSAMLKQELAAAGRVWLLCRHLDDDGRGWIDVADLRRSLTGRKAKGGGRKDEISAFRLPPLSFAIFGWRRLRQILGQGKGVFWNRDKQGRLWIYGAARVAANLGVERLQNRPILLPIADLTGTMGAVRAAFYAAFHAGRRENQPISRAAIESATGVPARTQFHYEETARIRRRKNVTIGAGWGSESAENSAYQHGNAVFRFVDYQGRHGPPGRAVVARQLPNSYTTALETCTRGRQRKVNAKLADLVIKGAGERSEAAFTKLYYRDARAMVEVVGRHAAGTVSYWPQLPTRGADAARAYSLWACHEA